MMTRCTTLSASEAELSAPPKVAVEAAREGQSSAELAAIAKGAEITVPTRGTAVNLRRAGGASTTPRTLSQGARPGTWGVLHTAKLALSFSRDERNNAADEHHGHAR